MVLGSLVLHLRLPGSHSLKDKRQIVKSVLVRLRNEFNVSAAEVGDQDTWQSAVLGIVGVSNDRRYIRGQLDAVVDWLAEHRPDAEVVDTEIELW
ncbi:MAG: DUF503 domain-containing protein [Herpetosiphon sp.]